MSEHLEPGPYRRIRNQSNRVGVIVGPAVERGREGLDVFVYDIEGRLGSGVVHRIYGVASTGFPVMDRYLLHRRNACSQSGRRVSVPMGGRYE